MEPLGADTPAVSPARLLYGVQPLIDEHAGEHQQQHSGAGAENPHRNRETIHFRDQFRLFLLHVRARVVEIQRLFLVHRERAAVDKENDQADGEDTPHDREPEH